MAGCRHWGFLGDCLHLIVSLGILPPSMLSHPCLSLFVWPSPPKDRLCPCGRDVTREVQDSVSFRYVTQWARWDQPCQLQWKYPSEYPWLWMGHVPTWWLGPGMLWHEKYAWEDWVGGWAVGRVLSIKDYSTCNPQLRGLYENELRCSVWKHMSGTCLQTVTVKYWFPFLSSLDDLIQEKMFKYADLRHNS